MTRTGSGLCPGAARRVLVFVALASARTAWAGETTLAEPIVEENITDVDATETGTLEVDLTGSSLAASNASKAGAWASELEAEWRPIDRLGFGASLGAEGATSGLAPTGTSTFVPRFAASYVFVRDREDRIFLQWETSARWDSSSAPPPSPLETELPVAFGVRWAAGAGPFVLRAGFFAEAGDESAHAPLHQSGAVLLRLFEAPVQLYPGVELVEDWARSAPATVVPEILMLTRVFGAPVRTGIGVPVTLGARQEGEIGIAFRFVLEPEE